MTYETFKILWVVTCAGPFWTIAAGCAAIGISLVVVALIERHNRTSL